MKREDIIYVDQHKIYCEDQGDSLGHPRVYLEIKDEQVVCPYCSRMFRIKK
jgi:uncharacterized Zn-finger protein